MHGLQTSIVADVLPARRLSLGACAETVGASADAFEAVEQAAVQGTLCMPPRSNSFDEAPHSLRV